MTRRGLLKTVLIVGMGMAAKVGGWLPASAKEFAGMSEEGKPYEVTKPDAEWRKILSPDQYAVLRKEGTEPPFKNPYWNHKAKGTYQCAGCQLPLFASEHKYDSGTGWPSFWQPISDSAIGTKTDWKLLLPRSEVHCSRCGGHLGHVFEDGPPPTGLRYCINSAALTFVSA